MVECGTKRLREAFRYFKIFGGAVGKVSREVLEGFFVSEALTMCSRRMLLWKAEKSFSACFSVAGGTFVCNLRR